ncbi:MAG: aspartate aminotransferase family protein [Gammaproteobacteria bacterium]|nr:aspartate aminotransferase family protein [Gammaproteobacteria bacterium]MCW8888710.1 aspartate aminotransferase family protein [Gammaproteobacteria bacterium]
MSTPLMNTYARLPVSFVKGEAATLWDSEGKSYLDALAGIAVCNLGHAHPAVTETICSQSAKLVHTSNLFGIPAQEQLGAALIKQSGMDNVFFSNSGAEANEAAIKLARLHGHKQEIENPAIIVMESSFHGRTMATLTATGNRKVHAGFEPLVQGFVRVPYDDLESIQTIAKHNKNIVAILVEPVQGEGGVNVPDENYLKGIREICDANNWLMMLDEIQTGIGRTGKMFAFQHSDIKPDVMTLAKGLGNGFPIGACLARGAAAELFQPGNHGTTYGGSPLGCSVAHTVVNTIVENNLIQRAEELGLRMVTEFELALGDQEFVKDIRGLGMMIGIELDRPCGQLVKMALEAGLIINVTADSVIRLLPPLIISDEEAEQIVQKVTQLIFDFVEQSGE